MAIITISRGSYSKGKEIAERLAKRLGYECISREILIDASKEFNIPEVKLIRALHDAPSVLDRFTYGKERYIAYIKCALLDRVKKDNVVYHGLAGHFFLQGIPNVIKVRIISNIEDRVKEEMKRENISEEEARKILEKDDYERRKWSLTLYGIDTADPRLYDMVFHVDTLKVDDIVDILEDVAKRPCFQTTDKAKKILHDRALAARIEAYLVDKFPSVRANCRDGVAYIGIKCVPIEKEKIIEEVRQIISRYEELKDIEVEIEPIGCIPD
jgi:cytidylate kinase